jgi:predicted MFS family arabinose efflux permease
LLRNPIVIFSDPPPIERTAMTITRRSPWIIVAAVYAISLLSMATVGVIVPSMSDYAARFGVGAGAIGLAISLFSAPSAVLAAIGGSAIDRIGLKPSLIFAVGLAVAGDLLAFIAPSILLFDAALLICGLGYAGIAVGGPALLMAVLEGPSRTRGMSFWSTYAPTGFAVGLLIAAIFVDGGGWRMALIVHAVLLATAGIGAAALLPAPTRAAAIVGQSVGQRLGQMLAVFRELPVLRLGIATALPNAISYGTSLVAPSYLARVHDVSVAASSSTVAVAKIFAMMTGGVLMGNLLSRQFNSMLLFGGMALVGIVAQTMLYLPSSSFPLATCSLVLWLFAFGGMSGTVMAVLPTVMRDPARAGAASGVVNQCIALASFCAPTVYFSMPGWTGFIALAGIGLLVSVAALPVRWGGTTVMARS